MRISPDSAYGSSRSGELCPDPCEGEEEELFRGVIESWKSKLFGVGLGDGFPGRESLG
jgi:hypothetical protein